MVWIRGSVGGLLGSVVQGPVFVAVMFDNSPDELPGFRF